MALRGGRLRDRTPARQPRRRRPGNRPIGLDGDEAPDPDRGAALDHGVEVRVRQHRLQQRDSHAGLALHRALPDDSPNNPTTSHLDALGHDLQVNYGIEWIITGLSFAAGFLAWFWPWAALPAQRFLPVVFAGLVINAVSLVATGGVHSHVMPLLMVIVVFSASLFEFRAAITIRVL